VRVCAGLRESGVVVFPCFLVFGVRVAPQRRLRKKVIKRKKIEQHGSNM